MPYKVRYLESVSILKGREWVPEKREKWVTFYPIRFGQIDDRPSSEVLTQDKIYGKAITGTCGFQSVWTYDTWDKKDIRTS